MGMKLRHVMGTGLALAMLSIATTSTALEDSRNGPFYVQGTVPLGLNLWVFGQGGGNWSGWRPDVEFGYHFSGRHDGIVLGLRQAFLVTAVPGGAGGTTQLRGGYDIPIPIGDFELNIAPFMTFGVGWIFDGPHAGINMSWGVDGKFFITHGFYAFARPLEMGFQCLHDSGNCAFAMVWGAGVGFAFPEP
jgi:hypothetical protein